MYLYVYVFICIYMYFYLYVLFICIIYMYYLFICIYICMYYNEYKRLVSRFPSDLMKSTVVDESLSSYKPMYCSREYQTSTRLNQQYEKSTLKILYQLSKKPIVFIVLYNWCLWQHLSLNAWICICCLRYLEGIWGAKKTEMCTFMGVQNPYGLYREYFAKLIGPT